MHERAAHREIDVDSLMKGRRRREPPHWAGRSFIYRVAGLGVGLGFLTDAEELCDKKPVCGPTPAPITHRSGSRSLQGAATWLVAMRRADRVCSGAMLCVRDDVSARMCGGVPTCTPRHSRSSVDLETDATWPGRATRALRLAGRSSVFSEQKCRASS